MVKTPPTGGSAADPVANQTIRDFGVQWTRYRDNSGYYGSLELLRDICEPLLDLDELRNSRVAEIGSGTGRIVQLLADAGASHVTAIEPSDGFEVLCRNTSHLGDRVTLLHATGDSLPAGLDLDFVFSIGVLHHLPEVEPVLRAAAAALRPGGRLLVWVYAVEGNEKYLAFVRPLRAVTTQLPHILVVGLSHALAIGVSGYFWGASRLGLKVKPYLETVMARLSYSKRHLVVYDQLSPRYAKHYSERELRELLTRCGYERVSTHHRHGYSWTAVAYRPVKAELQPSPV